MWNDLVINFKPTFIYQPKNLFQSKKDWKQKPDNDKLICYDIEFGKWDDIDTQTIRSYKVVHIEKDFKKKQKELTELNLILNPK